MYGCLVGVHLAMEHLRFGHTALASVFTGVTCHHGTLVVVTAEAVKTADDRVAEVAALDAVEIRDSDWHSQSFLLCVKLSAS